MQNLAASIAGWPVFGVPMWRLAELVPNGWSGWVEGGFLDLGLLASLLLIHRVADGCLPERTEAAWRAALPWWLLALTLFAAGWWILGQPTEMRGTFSVGG